MNAQLDPLLATIGTKTSDIDVRISYRIIELFSEGLYSSPNKAIEELVSNAFDAGALNVHVIVPPDPRAPDAAIVVIDDGIGMDPAGYSQHWMIGESNKRLAGLVAPRGRKQIGRFGIGKLATFVLARRLTHVSKIGGKYLAASMDFSKIPGAGGGPLYTDEVVKLPLRELTEIEARALLEPWIKGAKAGYTALKLFGDEAVPSWTAAVLSELKSMATEIRQGRLRWVLSVAMPLRDDFQLFLNGDPVPAAKLAKARIGHWILGKDLVDLPEPAPSDDLQVTEDATEPEDSLHRWGLTNPKLGRVTGYVELYEDLLTASPDAPRSHGFFVYVLGRLININDEYFGIDRNLLRHGTFSRFRMVVHVDRLDDELRSSRENVREGELYRIAQNILYAAFKFARSKQEEKNAADDPGARIPRRVAASPAALVRRPIVALVEAAYSTHFSPRYIAYPENLKGAERIRFLKELRERADKGEELVRRVGRVDLGSDRPIAILDVATGILQINTLHPFVAYFLDEFEDIGRNLPLELLAMSEVLLEAHLHDEGAAPGVIADVLKRRDEVLRQLARSTGRRNAYMVAQDLLDAANDKAKLETELVAAFDSMGFDAVPKGGSGKPDGIADAHLAAAEAGKPQRYKVSLEAKSKEQPGQKVTAKAVNISAIARQRDDFHADHAVVVGPDFPTSQGETSALLKEILAETSKSKNTITLIRVADLARLVRLVPLKRIDLGRIRSLFEGCRTPEEAKKWVDGIAEEQVKKPPYKVILETIYEEQQEDPNEPVAYAAVRTALRKGPKIILSTIEIAALCRALSRMAPEYVVTYDDSVELAQRPDQILKAIGATIGLYPEDEQKDSPVKSTKK